MNGGGWSTNLTPPLGTNFTHAVAPDIAWALQERDYKGADSDTKQGHLIVAGSFEQNSMGGRGTLGWADGDAPLRPVKPQGDHQMIVAHSLRADGFDASEDGTGRGTPIIPILEVGKGSSSRGEGPNGAGFGSDGDPMFTLQSGAQHAVAFTVSEQANGFAWEKEVVPAIQAHPQSDTSSRQSGIREGMSVRRLTPVECERLQGFPDDWTAIAYRGKPAADGPRYRALGNSMAVPVVRWILQRIEEVT